MRGRAAREQHRHMPALAPTAPDPHGTRVVVADAHPTVRRALRTLLTTEPGINLVADVATPAAAGAAVRRRGADVLVIASGLLGAGLHALGPLPASTAVVVLGMDADPGIADQWRRHGAAAYLLKDEAHLHLPEALRSVAGRAT
jgi:DNA-binding NarL/FixJ family response regulator